MKLKDLEKQEYWILTTRAGHVIVSQFFGDPIFYDHEPDNSRDRIPVRVKIVVVGGEK